MLKRITLIILVSSTLSIGYVMAQPGGNPGGGGKPGVPITGIELIIGAGALLGAKKLYSKRKRSSDL